MKSKTIIINGANSYISLNLIPLLLSKGFIIYAIARNVEEIKNISNSENYHWYTYEEFANAEISAGAFVHLAWKHSKNPNRNIIDKQLENTEFLSQQINFIRKSKCKNVYFANSFYVKELNNLIDNNSKNISPKYNYAIVKDMCSKMLRLSLPECNVIDLFISNVFGPNEKNSRFITYCFECWKNNKPLITKSGTGDFLYDFIYIKDAIELICKILSVEVHSDNKYDVCSNEPKLLSDYLGEMVKILPDFKIELGAEAFDNPKLLRSDFSYAKNLNHLSFKCSYNFKDAIMEIKEECIDEAKISKR